MIGLPAAFRPMADRFNDGRKNFLKKGLDILREYVLPLSHKAKPKHERRNTPPKQNDILREYAEQRKGE